MRSEKVTSEFDDSQYSERGLCEQQRMIEVESGQASKLRAMESLTNGIALSFRLHSASKISLLHKFCSVNQIIIMSVVVIIQTPPPPSSPFIYRIIQTIRKP